MGKLRLALDKETINHGNLEASQSTSSSLTNTSQSSTTSLNSSAMNDLGLGISDSPQPLLKSPSSTSQDPTRLKQQQHILNQQTKHDMALKALLLGQSEERVQALSVIMLHLCSGLQHAQGVAGQG